MFSYSQIAKHNKTPPHTQTNTNTQVENITKTKPIENHNVNVNVNVMIKYIKPIEYHDQIMLIKPYSKNIYSKNETYKWLHYKIDNNYFHYDYCVRLFELLMKWVKINNFKIAISEDILLAKFISLMYLLSNKQGYD